MERTMYVLFKQRRNQPISLGGLLADQPMSASFALAKARQRAKEFWVYPGDIVIADAATWQPVARIKTPNLVR